MSDTERDRESFVAPGEAADVFVSYAHEDRAFVVKVHQALRERGRTAWVDWEGIPPSAEWMVEMSCPAFSGQGILRLFTRLPAFPAARP